MCGDAGPEKRHKGLRCEESGVKDAYGVKDAFLFKVWREANAV